MPPQPLPDPLKSPGKADLLIVEDEAVFARAVAKRLDRAGYRCRTAGTLNEARRFNAQQSFDAILLDLRLPDGNGLEWLAELAPTPVVVLSAYGDIADAVQAMKQGAADYLRKPLDLDELVVTLEHVLQQARTASRLRYAQERERRPVRFPP